MPLHYEVMQYELLYVLAREIGSEASANVILGNHDEVRGRVRVLIIFALVHQSNLLGLLDSDQLDASRSTNSNIENNRGNCTATISQLS